MQRRKWALLGLATTVLTATGVTVATSADAAAGCAVTYTVGSQWPGGFSAGVDVTNLGAPTTAWSLVFTFPAGQSISQLWGGTVTRSGSTVTVRNASWNGALATDATVSFGFNGSWAGSNPVPAAFTLNGTTCTGGVPGPSTSTSPSAGTSPGASTSPSAGSSPSASTSTSASTSPSASAGPGTGPGTGAPTRIMALGDSITGSPGCWRALLWRQLPASDVDFVGTLPGDGCGFPYDSQNEGHGGFLVTDVARRNQLPGWLAAGDPDVVLMHFGTNDAWSNLPTATILDAYTTLVGQMRAANPAMRIIVAQIIPLNPPTCADCGRRVVDLNAAVPGWAASLSTATSPITVVDQWTGFDTATDTYDGVHPNDAGNVKIAARWLPAVRAAIG